MIYICVRQTTDWADEATFRAQLPPSMRESVELWNRTFSIPYHLFRHRLKEIAALSWSRVRGARVVPRSLIPEEAIVVPTDDDDWFAPHLAEVLEPAFDPRFAGCSWTSSYLEVPTNWRHELGEIRRRVFPRTPPKLLCTTNNYAFALRPWKEPWLDNHLRAEEWFRGHPDEVLRLDTRLSVMNRTLASTTSLRLRRGQMTRPELMIKYLRYRRLYRRALPDDVTWCRPYYEMLQELAGELRLR